LKIVTLDIETSPNLAYVWGMFKQNIGLNQLVETGEVMCFSAKWYGQAPTSFYSTYHHGKEAMVEAAHEILDEADAVIHYNGKRFDIPHLNREFLAEGLTPPSPFAHVDLLNVAKKQFRFTSNKLDHVAQQLGLGAKTSHTGFQLWVDCMAGNAEAWELMKTYNEQDVVLTEKVYDALLPWIPSHPNYRLYHGGVDDLCPNCGSKDLRKEGKAYTSVSVFQRFRCEDCGKWSRGNQRLDGSAISPARHQG
jgi:DNA polymerase elongation subunit (family B)